MVDIGMWPVNYDGVWPPMRAEIMCCGIWMPYPQPGNDTQCSECGTRYTVRPAEQLPANVPASFKRGACP